jgi:hypothetical protein
MIALPVFERLLVQGYGLYPGLKSRPGLSAEIAPGLTLVLGANGLGKTTLVTLLYRMCSGPYDLPAGGGDLGGRKVVPRRLSAAERRMFADRVLDGAEHAQASLTFKLRDCRVEVTRWLADLRIASLTMDGDEADPNEGSFQEMITTLSGLPSFSDWLLLLRHLTFYFEDRRALVWDPSAQRQILRLLFLPTDVASEWTALERAILSNDSAMRNLQNVLGKEERQLATSEAALGDADTVRDALKTHVTLQEVDEPRLRALEDQLASLESRRQDARLDALRAELEHESAYRDLERRQLMAIAAEFPTEDETTAYVLARLMSDDDCLVCGHHVPAVATAMRDRLANQACSVCGSPLDEPDDVKLFSPRALTKARRVFEEAEKRLQVARGQRDASDERYAASVSDAETLRSRVTERSAKIDALVRQLPPDEAALHEQRRDLAAMRLRVETLRDELAAARSAFSSFIQGVNRRVVRQKGPVERQFEYFASGFLLETCALVWRPHRDRVGQSGEQIAYPAYELEMTGTDFNSPVRRTGPDQVSESQREFVDLAFRMALMSVACDGGVGSLVIDAPESSLDAVFVTRAADVLTRFANGDSDNRLIVTSNLVAGNLIPELLHRARITSRSDPRIVDLLKLAAPTRATSTLAGEYERVQRRLFKAAREI